MRAAKINKKYKFQRVLWALGPDILSVSAHLGTVFRIPLNLHYVPKYVIVDHFISNSSTVGLLTTGGIGLFRKYINWLFVVTFRNSETSE